MKSKSKSTSKPAAPSLSWPESLFKFLASLRLAIFVLSALILSLAAGTILESLYGTDAARGLIYQSVWFSAILFLLGVNVAAAALDRLPWKRKHTGFVITHIGILIILFGSFITQRLMIDGQMAMNEKESQTHLTLTEPLLYLFSEDNQKGWLLPLKKPAFPWQGPRVRLNAKDLPFEIYQTGAYPKARIEEKFETADEGPAAVEVLLDSSFVHQNQWLVENDPDLADVQLGPAKLKFAKELLAETAAPRPAEQGYIEFLFSNHTQYIPLAANLKLPADFRIEGTPYQIRLTRILKNAAIKEKNLKEAEGVSPQTASNPAVEFELKGKGVSEIHTVFARFPDFPTAHGLKPSASGAKIYYRLSEGGSKMKDHELRFVKQGQNLLYQIKSGMEIKTGNVKLGEEVPLGWMDLKMKVNRILLHSKREKEFIPLETASESPEAVQAIELQIGKDGAQKFWLGQGMPLSFEVTGKKYQAVLGLKRIPVGFELTLKDFRVTHYPGTEKPASFESDVILKDPRSGFVKETTVSMNQPLEYQGFKIYQAGYDQKPGQPELSIFSVGRDPGIPIKYAGALVMVLGVVLMFYTKKFSTSGEKKL